MRARPAKACSAANGRSLDQSGDASVMLGKDLPRNPVFTTLTAGVGGAVDALDGSVGAQETPPPNLRHVS
jgi:hypothetical protein